MKIKFFFLLYIVIYVTACQTKNKQPNVLFISIDDLRPELGCYGASHIISPNIDELANDALLFNNAYCQYAVCCPSRTSVLTGLRPDQTGVYSNREMFRDYIPNEKSLPQLFKENGYYTHAIGKVFHSNIFIKDCDDTKSWSKATKYVEEESSRWGYIEPIKNKNGVTGRQKSIEITNTAENEYWDAQIANHTIDFLNNHNTQKPFFLAVGFKKPHLPFVTDKKTWDLYKGIDIKLPSTINTPENAPNYALKDFVELRKYSDIPQKGKLSEKQSKDLIRAYYACVSFIDNQVGKVIKALKENNLYDNTIIVVWGDHGWKLGDYSNWTKQSNFEVDTRVPLIIYSPDMRRKGEKTSAIVELVDIFPTLCELAKIDIPKNRTGNSLVSLLDIENVTPSHKYAISQYQRKGKMGYTIKDKGFRYVKWLDDSDNIIAQELYNHKKDSLETTNVANNTEYEKQIVRLNKVLEKYITPNSMRLKKRLE